LFYPSLRVDSHNAFVHGGAIDFSTGNVSVRIQQIEIDSYFPSTSKFLRCAGMILHTNYNQHTVLITMPNQISVAHSFSAAERGDLARLRHTFRYIIPAAVEMAYEYCDRLQGRTRRYIWGILCSKDFLDISANSFF
jgi:hypothetical protein